MAEDHSGHRARLKKRFVNMEPYLYEPRMSVELLLFGCVARRDTTDLSQRLLTRFGSFRAIFDADAKTLDEVREVGAAVGSYIEGYSGLMRRFALEYAACRPLRSQTAFEVMFERICTELSEPCAVVLFTDGDGRAVRFDFCEVCRLQAVLSVETELTVTVCINNEPDERKINEAADMLSEIKRGRISPKLFICRDGECRLYCSF